MDRICKVLPVENFYAYEWDEEMNDDQLEIEL